MHSRFVMAMLRSESGSIGPQELLQISDAAPADSPDWEFVKRA